MIWRSEWLTSAARQMAELSNFHEAEALFPRGQHRRKRGDGLRVRRHPQIDLAPGIFEDLAVTNQIDRAKRGQSGLSRAEEVAGAAQREIAFSDFEPVRRFRHRAESCARLIRQWRLIQEQTVRLMPIAADTPA